MLLPDSVLGSVMAYVFLLLIAWSDNRRAADFPVCFTTVGEKIVIFATLFAVWFVTSVGATFISSHMSFAISNSVSVRDTGLLFMYVLVLAPLTEELFYRGVVFCRTVKQYPIFIAYLGSAVFFGVIHFTVPQFYAGVFCGLFFALVYHVTGRIRYAILCHMIYNIMTLMFSGVMISEFFFKGWVAFGMSLLLFGWLMYLISRVNQRLSSNKQV